MRFRKAISLWIIGIGTASCLSAAPAHAESSSDAAVSVYGNFTGSTTANGTVQSPSSSAGLLLELRHISNPLMGYELNYSMNGGDQTYDLHSVKANAHQVGASWIFSVPLATLRPFVQLGGGLVIFSPKGNQPDTSGQTKPAFVYGAGLDWTLLPHVGLRFQYRGDLYNTPDLLNTATSTHQLTESAQPMVGAYVSF